MEPEDLLKFGLIPEFVGRLPVLATLAASSVETVVERWAGLGYYSRARNLHAAARSRITSYNVCYTKLLRGQG